MSFVSFFDRRPWRKAENCGYLARAGRCKISILHELFTESPCTDNEIEERVVGIVTSYRFNESTGRARVTLLDETGLINGLIDQDLILTGGLMGYVRIGAVIVAKTTVLFTLSTEPPAGCVYINYDCIVAIISTSGEVIPGNYFNLLDDDDDDGDDDDDNVV